jgi:hypothetical protein
MRQGGEVVLVACAERRREEGGGGSGALLNRHDRGGGMCGEEWPHSGRREGGPGTAAGNGPWVSSARALCSAEQGRAGSLTRGPLLQSRAAAV